MSLWDKPKQLVTCWCQFFIFYFSFPREKLVNALMQASIEVFVSSVVPVFRIL